MHDLHCQREVRARIVAAMQGADMTSGKRRIRALGLLSGGLDSQLAAYVVRAQGVVVEAVFFESPFCDAARSRQAAAALGVHLHVLDFTPDILDLLRHAPHGFGACLNPCIDCHARMLRRTGRLMEDLGFDFIFTGEVLNQRPMSQRRYGLAEVARDSGYAEYILRPLSAGLLAPTLPEQRGWIDRAQLLSIEGRSRKIQMALARAYDLKSYPTPAGGCRLTEPNFCRRLTDLRLHGGIPSLRAVELLKVGRHIRLGERVKLVVGRNAGENARLAATAELYDAVLLPATAPGPTALLPVEASEEDLLRAASFLARYCDGDPDTTVAVLVRTAAGVRRLDAPRARAAEIEGLLV